MTAYPEGAWPVTTAYPAQHQQQLANVPAYGTPEYTVYYTYWNSPAGLAIRQSYDQSAYAQNPQQYAAAAQLNAAPSHDAAPPLPTENLVSNSFTPSGQHAPSGSSANAAKPEPAVPGQEAASKVEPMASQPPLPQSETSDPSYAPTPTPQQATPYIVNQYGNAPGVAGAAATYSQYNIAGQYGVSQEQQQFARQAAWSTLTLQQQQQYHNQSSMQQAAYAPQQQAYQTAPQPHFMAGQHQQASTYQHLHNQATPGYAMPSLGAASHHNVAHPSSMYSGWPAPSNSQSPHQQQQLPPYNHPYNSHPPTHAPALVPPASAGMIIRPQWAKQPPPNVASHQSTFPPPSVPTPQHRPPAYTQVGAIKPPTPFTGIAAAPYTHIHTQRVPLAAPSTPAPLTPTAAKPLPIIAGPQPPKTGMGKFPANFPPYVERCFARCKLDGTRALMTTRLQRKIQDVETAGRLWLVDWDTEPPPSLDPEAPVSAAASSTSSPHAPGQRKRPWGPENEHANSSPARSRFDVKGEAVDSKDRRKLGYGAAPDSHAHHYESPPNAFTKKQKKAAMAAERARGSFSHPSQAGARITSTAASGPGRLSAAAAAEDDRRQQRSGRFKDGRAIAGGGVMRSRRAPGGYSSSSDEDSDSELDLTDVAIKGTCTDLEKSYFRLTAAPDPYLVRPESVLKAAYARLLTLLATGNAGYFYACDQLKGMRQDLTVQRIRSPLAVLIYEMHARSALEYGDFAEFNQCQTQLHTILYTGEGAGGCRGEFHAYMLLYQSVHARLGLNKALLHSMQAVTPELAATRAVDHALQVRQAMMQENYAAFFRLYSTATGLGRAIMDVAVPKIRWAALNTLIKVYKTSLPVSLFAEVLGFVPRPAQPVAASAAPTPDSLQNATVQASASMPTPSGLQASAVQQEERAAPVIDSLQDSEMRLNASESPAPDCAMETGPKACTVPTLDSVDDKEPACTDSVPDSLHDSEMQETSSHDLAPCSTRDVCDSVPAQVLLPGCIHVGYVGRFKAEESTADGMAACVAWLTSHGAVLENATASEPMVDVKLSVGQLKIPTEVSKVAHGDENLSLDDFLNRASLASAAR